MKANKAKTKPVKSSRSIVKGSAKPAAKQTLLSKKLKPSTTKAAKASNTSNASRDRKITLSKKSKPTKVADKKMLATRALKVTKQAKPQPIKKSNALKKTTQQVKRAQPSKKIVSNPKRLSNKRSITQTRKASQPAKIVKASPSFLKNSAKVAKAIQCAIPKMKTPAAVSKKSPVSKSKMKTFNTTPMLSRKLKKPTPEQAKHAQAAVKKIKEILAKPRKQAPVSNAKQAQPASVNVKPSSKRTQSISQVLRMHPLLQKLDNKALINEVNRKAALHDSLDEDDESYEEFLDDLAGSIEAQAEQFIAEQEPEQTTSAELEISQTNKTD